MLGAGDGTHDGKWAGVAALGSDAFAALGIDEEAALGAGEAMR